MVLTKSGGCWNESVYPGKYGQKRTTKANEGTVAVFYGLLGYYLIRRREPFQVERVVRLVGSSQNTQSVQEQCRVFWEVVIMCENWEAESTQWVREREKEVGRGYEGISSEDLRAFLGALQVSLGSGVVSEALWYRLMDAWLVLPLVEGLAVEKELLGRAWVVSVAEVVLERCRAGILESVNSEQAMCVVRLYCQFESNHDAFVSRVLLRMRANVREASHSRIVDPQPGIFRQNATLN